MEAKRDQLFMQILKQEKDITNFLDAFFGFLCRCTSFYIESGHNGKPGFLPGAAEELVLNSLRKWKTIRFSSSDIPAETELNHSVILEEQESSFCPAATQEVEVETENESEKDYAESESSNDKEYAIHVQTSDCYNGAIRDQYTWSQTITDLDVIIKIPNDLKTAKDLRLNLDAKQMKVDLRTCLLLKDKNEDHTSKDSEWTTIFEGELNFKTRKDESVWSLVPGQYVSIHLEKASERWWESLLVDEPKIELNKIDCSRHLEEMGQDEQMKIQELMWNQQQKMLGKPAADQIRMEKILKQAWDARGSPFRGTPYDPSILKFN